MATEREVAGVAILEKVGAVIKALDRLGESTVSELSYEVNEPVSSVYRLLANLVQLGWVDPGSRRGRYRLGLYFVRIGGMFEERLEVREACEPSLRQLHERTRETTFLCFRRGDFAVCVDRMSGREVQSLAMRLGDSLPLYKGAAPSAILAFLPAEEREAVLARIRSLRENGEEIPADSELRRRVERTRERGYSISDGDVTPGIAAIGVPVFNHRRELEGAISVSGIRERILVEGQDVIQLVQEAGLRSSEALGFKGGEH